MLVCKCCTAAMHVHRVLHRVATGQPSGKPEKVRELESDREKVL